MQRDGFRWNVCSADFDMGDLMNLSRYTPNRRRWRIEAIHPGKVDPWDKYHGDFTSERDAKLRVEELRAAGFDPVHLFPPEPVPAIKAKPLDYQAYKPFSGYRRR